jgi:hypothetical protein
MSYRPRPVVKLPLAAAGCAVAALLSTPLAMAQSEAAPPTVQAHRVVIDAVTGRPRAPEAGEWSEAPAPGAAQRSAARAAPSTGGLENHSAMKRIQAGQLTARPGTIGRRVDPSRLSYTVARSDANGVVSTQCVTGDEAAHKALHGAAQGDSHDH